jgi:hypothetical protein
MDGTVDLGDTMDPEHLELLVDYCDANQDGTVTNCEIFDCYIIIENEWRDAYCAEGYTHLYCDSETYFDCPHCDGIWTCGDIVDITEEFFATYNTNGDSVINMGDNID